MRTIKMSFFGLGGRGSWWLEELLKMDDVEIVAIDGAQVEALWEARNVEGEPVVTYADHTLTIRR